ncbi:MAG: serine kinase [Lentisphaeria bacterium]|nr:serine kinase [Lentisphaeria bacterium]
MKLDALINELGLVPIQVDESAEIEVKSAYCGDLLSDVLAHCEPDAVWFTVQGHINVVAVAELRDAACVVIVNGVSPDPQAVAKAQLHGVALLGSEESSAALCMRLAGKL